MNVDIGFLGFYFTSGQIKVLVWLVGDGIVVVDVTSLEFSTQSEEIMKNIYLARGQSQFLSFGKNIRRITSNGSHFANF